MSKVQGKPLAIACGLAVAIAVSMVDVPARAAAGTEAEDRLESFAADLTIRRVVREAAANAETSDASAMVYRWTRRRAAGRWKTVLRVVSSGRPARVTTAGQSIAVLPAITRIEDDGDGAGPRFYAAGDVLVRVPDKAVRRKMNVREDVFARTDALTSQVDGVTAAGATGEIAGNGSEWLDSILPSRDRSAVRKAALRRQFGRSEGTVRGRDRYVTTVGAETTEVLADTTWGVPLEVNVVRGGVLYSHATIEYAARPGGGLLRQRTHAERLVPEAPGRRLSVDVELANVTLEGGR